MVLTVFNVGYGAWEMHHDRYRNRIMAVEFGEELAKRLSIRTLYILNYILDQPL